MAVLGKLQSDSVLQILDILWQTCPSSISSLVKVSKDLYLLARPILYRTLQFTLSKSRDESNERLMDIILRDKQVQPFVWEINIRCFPSELPKLARASRRRWLDMIQLLPQLRGLRHLSYTVETSFAMKGLNFEESSLEHEYKNLPELIWLLQKRPATCRLSVALPARVDLISVLPYFINDSSLYSLSIVVHRGQVLASESVLGIVSTCPNLRQLRIESCDFTDALAPLFIAFPGRRHAAAQLHKVQLSGSTFVLERPEDGEADKPLFDFLDARAVTELSLNPPIHPLKTTSNSANLRSLQMDISTSLGANKHRIIKTQLNMLLMNQRLEELCLTGSMDTVSIESLEPQEHSLRSLTIHENEDETGICKRLVFSDCEIERLSKALPSLKELSLDLNYDGRWPLETLSTISRSFPSLIHLGLNLEINISHPQKPIHPAATANSALHIWNHIWRETQAFRLTRPHLLPRPRLRSLSISAGSFRYGHESATTHKWARYERREQQTFRILRSERDDEADAGIASVTCVQVEELLTKYGTGPVSVSVQERLLGEARERAENGVMAEPRERRIHRRAAGGESVLLLPYEDFRGELETDTVMPFFDNEELWLSKLT